MVLSGRWASVAMGTPPAPETPADDEEEEEKGCGGVGRGRRGGGCCCCWEPDVVEEL